MEEVEKVSIALNLSLLEIEEVEVPILAIVNMDNEASCSKSDTTPSVHYASKAPATYTDKNSSSDDDVSLDKTSGGKPVGSENEKGNTDNKDQRKKRKQGQSDQKKEEKKRSHKNKKKEETEKKAAHESDDDDDEAQQSKPNSKKEGKSGKKEKPKKQNQDDDDAEENSSDEDVNSLNKVANQLSEFRSIKDLPVRQMFRVLKFEIVETVNGRTVRLQLEDATIDEGFFYVHLPRRFLPSIETNLTKYSNISKSKKPFFFTFLGQKGRSFKVLFTRNPEKQS